MTRISLERTIAADPTSAALLVCAAARTSRAAGNGVTVRAEATLRTEAAFVTRFELSVDGVPGVAGVLTLAVEPGPGVTAWTHATVRLDGPSYDEGVREVVARLLGDLADAAERRAFAA